MDPVQWAEGSGLLAGKEGFLQDASPQIRNGWNIVRKGGDRWRLNLYD